MAAPRSEIDERLLVEAAQRDPRRFAELYEINFQRVYAYVVRRVQSREEAEDVTSEVFRHALAKIRTYEWRGAPFAAWLIRIAANAVMDRWRRTQREGTRREPLLEDFQGAGTSHVEIEQQAEVFHLVEGLPPDQRRVVLLRFVEQKSIREIAQEIGRTEGAVKQLQFRALQKLRALIEGANA